MKCARKPTSIGPTRRAVLRWGTAMLLSSPAASAQEAGRVYRLGVLSPGSRSEPARAAFFDELSHHGFIENRNLAVDPRGFGVTEERMDALARDFVEAGVDALVPGGDAAIRAVQRATKSIPIVAVSDDLLASKFVTSFARPGGNLTGISIFARELDAKRQEILIEMIPGIRRIAVLGDPLTTGPDKLEALVQAGRARGVDIAAHRAATPGEAAAAIAAAKAEGAEAINILASALFNRIHASSSAWRSRACRRCTSGRNTAPTGR